MAIRLDPKHLKVIKKQIADSKYNYEKALIYQLEYAVEEFINHAKDNGEYTDRTSNLRSSIGGAVIKNGKAVSYKGFEIIGEQEDGVETGMEFLNKKIEEFRGSGIGIILVAGMEYAGYVEDYRGKNVIKKTELHALQEMPKLIRQVKRIFEKAGALT